MTSSGTALAAAAEELVGTRFRLRGRDPATGLDCVGLLAAALKRSGRQAPLPSDYSLRQADITHTLRFVGPAGFEDADGPICAGDVVLVRPGPAQFHLAIAASIPGFVHAHAGLRRVVLSPAPLEWPIERHWRLTQD